ncbi:hypothetical protein GLOIN_2v1469570 [Rhizophagus irregularis DAOM 181602=DAOM 197198]|uniref:Uncharacterized protein n=1 Tax=Rhizophagus irregularis (strain DAOM 181602 / DAOM 197198 / MUCL 43194) TaxID=747089 RepID=A0A2P4QZQ9_RHIID|nr:hypothetical protein GLOIN_2v1469570 [Rhizophagus irregularis DAOM 181602=DAOM 197198]POG83092.1 hypothetical protein GLOIN_2v1469570 [Rhizophagus irregularis DAOM 181602=DAOM 197198]|eukprot:XP_025189958.1 hypothetical protein GLOIN_2v1469570 [Rhizophagus irregularis DAOM 181602=DAOM 197198]
MSNSNQQRPYEEENYPISPEIIYYGDRKFVYIVIQEGIYPPAVNYTEAPNYFPIPDNYTIKTTWGRANNSCTIQCSIYYVEEKPHYLICFGDNLQYQVFSAQSPFDASVELHKIITPDRRTAVSGVHLFGLQLKCINRNCKGRPRELKLHKESSKTTQIKRAKGLAKKEQVHFENTIKDFYNPKDRVVLKAIDFTVENKEYHVTFGDENYVKKKQKLQSIAYVQDLENIPRDAYLHLAAVESILPREYAISQTRQEINAYMEELIPINFIDLNSTIMQEGFLEEPDITDPLIIEQVINATGKGAYRSVKKILEFIIPLYVEKGILDPAIPTIHLRISGFNAANSNNFCPWCEITKNQRGNGQNDWTISKSMSSLNENPTAYPGHKLPPLFNMISLKNHVPDKLHIMLRITDRLWELVLQEIKNEGLFNDITRNIIIKEMENLKIRFEFWNIHGTNNWNYTSLMGDDKLCVLRNFNLTKLFDPERAALIKSLWDGFAELYDLLGEKTTDPQYFRLKAKVWCELFLKKTVIDSKTNTILEQGLYRSSDITPYIHVLVSHVWEFMLIHKRWGLNAFSCSAVEKKNHDHVCYFFKKTLKNGGKF